MFWGKVLIVTNIDINPVYSTCPTKKEPVLIVTNIDINNKYSNQATLSDRVLIVTNIDINNGLVEFLDEYLD